jgi:hypothetical protein
LRRLQRRAGKPINKYSTQSFNGEGEFDEHIRLLTRKSDPFETEGPDISVKEWAELVANDPDLSIADPPAGVPTAKTIYAVWNAYPGGITLGHVWYYICDEEFVAHRRPQFATAGGRGFYLVLPGVGRGFVFL